MHYLYKGGRIGKVASLMGSILGIKPVIRVQNGIYVPAGKARTIKQALSSIVDFLTKRYRRQKVLVAIGHGQGADYAAMLGEMVISGLNVAGKPVPFEVGPVIGVHTGPGTVGLAVRPVEYQSIATAAVIEPMDRIAKLGEMPAPETQVAPQAYQV
jgi:DegV family protein with EDD domain